MYLCVVVWVHVHTNAGEFKVVESSAIGFTGGCKLYYMDAGN